LSLGSDQICGLTLSELLEFGGKEEVEYQEVKAQEEARQDYLTKLAALRLLGRNAVPVLGDKVAKTGEEECDRAAANATNDIEHVRD